VYINQYLAWFLRMKRPGHDLSWKAIRRRRFHQNNPIHCHKRPSTLLLENSSKSLLANITNTGDQLLIPVINHVQNSSNHETNNVLLSYDMNFSRSDIRMILSELKFLTDHVRNAEEDDNISQDWKFSAMVIDRLCLILFTIMTTIFSYITLFSAPNFFKLR
jgi:nicotinic acetylcholine receptor